MDISPSSDVVEKKTGYLGLAPVSVLSRKLSFMMIGEVFRAENSITRKNQNPETFGTSSLEGLLSGSLTWVKLQRVLPLQFMICWN